MSFHDRSTEYFLVPRYLITTVFLPSSFVIVFLLSESFFCGDSRLSVISVNYDSRLSFALVAIYFFPSSDNLFSELLPSSASYIHSEIAIIV